MHKGMLERVDDGNIQTRSVLGGLRATKVLQGLSVAWGKGFSALRVWFSNIRRAIIYYKAVIQIYDMLFKSHLDKYF